MTQIFASVKADTPKSSDKLKFAFITCAVEAKFFEPVKKGMHDAASMLDVSCVFMGTEGVDVSAQAEMVLKAVQDGYDGIALNIIDPEAFDAVIQKAIDAGVPVVGFNIDDHATPNARLAGVNQQLYKAGERLAEHVLPFIPENSHLLMTMHDKGVSALEDRLAGLMSVIKKNNPKWSVLFTANESEKGAEKIADFSKSNPDVNILLGSGQSDTEAAGIAIEKYYSGRRYWAAGFDLSEKTLKLIEDGHIRCTVDQQPYIQGF